MTFGPRRLVYQKPDLRHHSVGSCERSRISIWSDEWAIATEDALIMLFQKMRLSRYFWQIYCFLSDALATIWLLWRAYNLVLPARKHHKTIKRNLIVEAKARLRTRYIGLKTQISQIPAQENVRRTCKTSLQLQGVLLFFQKNSLL